MPTIKGTKFTKEHKFRISLSKLADKNPQWKGKNVGLVALHQWVKSRLKKTKLCECCKKVPPYDLANISQNYKRDLSDWEWLCRSCHMKKDGRIDNLHKERKGSKNGFNKLDEKQVYRIKTLFLKGISEKAISIRYKVSLSCIRHIKYGHNWNHVIIGADLPKLPAKKKK